MTDKNMIENGRRLFQSVENLRRSADDLTAMTDSIGALLEELEFGGNEFAIEKSKDRDEKTEWCRLAQSYDVDVKQNVGDKRKKEKILGTITIITRLCDFKMRDDGDRIHPWNLQACVIVGWHKASDWIDDEPEYWAIEQLDPEEAHNIHHRDNGLWAWRDEDDDSDYAYFFALPVFAISNKRNLETMVIAPLKTLFQAEDPNLPAAEALSGVPVLTPSP